MAIIQPHGLKGRLVARIGTPRIWGTMRLAAEAPRPADRLFSNDPQNLDFQRHERGHLLLPVPRYVVGSHQPAEAVAKSALGGFVGHLEISYRAFCIMLA
jgi:hypothetical protein